MINYKSQQGVVLFSSLMFLIVLTLLGLSVLKISTMSINLSRNDEVLMKSFNQAEHILREGEQELSVFTDTPGFTDFENKSSEHRYISPINRSNISWIDGQSAGNDTTGRYILVYSGLRPINTESASLKSNGGISGSNLYLTNIISWGSENGAGAKKVIQTTFTTLTQP